MLEKNQFVTAEITDITSDGNGVCKVDGMAVFVPDTAVGDIVEIKIVKVLKKYAYGIISRISESSPDRIKADCPVYKQCGGCTFRHMNYESECRIKANIVENAFRRIGGRNPKFEKFISADKINEYRNKAQYPVTSVNGKVVCGFYAERSHRVIPITDCMLQPKVFSEILETVLEYINSKKISAYSEETNTGIMRHIYIRKGTYSDEIMLCFVVRKDVSRQLTSLCRIISEKFPDVKSIVMNINPDKTNIILGKKCIMLYGCDTVSDTMCGNKTEISPLSFYQVNTVQAEKIYGKALEFADPTSENVIADLYCGAGTIGLSMAQKAKKIIGIEVVPEAVENARQNAVYNNITNAEFHCGDAGKVFEELGLSPDIIVIDPPRKGCAYETVKTIAESSPQ
nr:23S rRNA (uracil(1939)-C(5))-methyltransferase RlmD [Ruminococcus sp.]